MYNKEPIKILFYLCFEESSKSIPTHEFENHYYDVMHDREVYKHNKTDVLCNFIFLLPFVTLLVIELLQQNEEPSIFGKHYRYSSTTVNIMY